METLTGLFMARVDEFLGRTRVAPATLGWQAVGDPNLVRELRLGRSPTLAFDQAHLGRVSARGTRLRDSASRARRGRAMTRAIEHELQVPIRILRLPDVLARTGLSRSTIYVRLAEGSFPKPVQLGGRAVGWIESDVDTWIRERIAASRGEAE